MVYKRYAKKNGKIYGPYYYESYRENGVVKKLYIGQKTHSIHPGSVVSHKKSFKILAIVFALFFLVLLGFFLFKQGKVVLQIEPSYNLGEPIRGLASLVLEGGDSIQKDVQIRLILSKDGTTLAEASKTLEEFLGDQIDYVNLTLLALILLVQRQRKSARMSQLLEQRQRFVALKSKRFVMMNRQRMGLFKFARLKLSKFARM